MSDTVTAGSGATGMQDRASDVAGTARQQAGEVAGTAKEQVASMASTAGEQAKAVAADARDQTRRLVDDGRQELRRQASEQSQRAASSLRDLGDQIQRMAAGEGAPEGPVGDLTRQAADSVQRVADRLASRGPDELVQDVKRFARERPGVFVLGALGAGFLAGRLLRTVDTSAITEAAKSSMGSGEPDSIAGPGALGALQTPGATDLGAGDAMAAGMAGTTPADLYDPPTTAVPTVPTAPSFGSER